MGKKNILFKSEEYKDRASVAAFFRELADKLEAGEVTFMQGSDEVTVSLPGTVELEVEVEDKAKKNGDVKHQIEIEIEWRDSDHDSSGVQLA